MLYLYQFLYNHFVFVFRWEEKLPMSKSPLESTWLYHEIGRCYLELQKYQDARDFGEKSLAAAKEAEDDGWQLHASVLVAQSEGMLYLSVLHVSLSVCLSWYLSVHSQKMMAGSYMPVF